MRIQRSSSGQYIVLDESEQQVASANTLMEAIQTSNRVASQLWYQRKQEKEKEKALKIIVTDYIQSDS